MTEKPLPPEQSDDRRVPTEWEETVGKDPVTPGDKAQLQEALEAMQRLQASTDAKKASDHIAAARAALDAAKLKPKSVGPSQSDNPAFLISQANVERGKQGVSDARAALHGESTPEEPPITPENTEDDK